VYETRRWVETTTQQDIPPGIEWQFCMRYFHAYQYFWPELRTEEGVKPCFTLSRIDSPSTSLEAPVMLPGGHHFGTGGVLFLKQKTRLQKMTFIIF